LLAESQILYLKCLNAAAHISLPKFLPSISNENRAIFANAIPCFYLFPLFVETP